MIVVYLRDFVEDTLREEFPDTFQELKDTFNPSPIQQDGPTVTVYCHEENIIVGYRHNLNSDTWSESVVGQHAWEVEGEGGMSSATTESDLYPVGVNFKSETEVKSFLSQSFYDGYGGSDICFHSINPPSCKLTSYWRESEVIRERYVSDGSFTYNPYSISSITSNFWCNLKSLVSVGVDEWGEPYNPILSFFRGIRDYTPRYTYDEYPPFWENYAAYRGDGNLPFPLWGNTTVDELFDDNLSRLSR